MTDRPPTKRIGIGVIGFGWMGQTHSRSYRRIPMHFPERAFEPELVVCADVMPTRREEAVRSFGFREATADWRVAASHPDVDVVTITAPNTLHVEIVEAAAAARKHIFCEKPVGGTPQQTARAEAAACAAGVITGVGYNFRWAPMVQYAKRLIDEGRLGRITNYRGRFFSMYGSDPLGLLSWRFIRDQAGLGVSSDLLSHSVDLAHLLVGPIARVVATGETFITERPLPKPGDGTHYDRGAPGDPTGSVTNEDYMAVLVVFACGARGTFEASRTILGPESQNAFEVYGTGGALAWNFERMNELQVFLGGETSGHSGFTTVFSGDRYPPHGHFVPGAANGIGYEELKVIEAYEFLAAVARGEPVRPNFTDALEFVKVQDAMFRSWKHGRWEEVGSVMEAPATVDPQ
jgi:predicted dehydrogenase